MAAALVGIATTQHFRHPKEYFGGHALLVTLHRLFVLLDEPDIFQLLPSRPFTFPALTLQKRLDVGPGDLRTLVLGILGDDHSGSTVLLFLFGEKYHCG